ncbi:MAG TPA: PepSY-like domain-containing protein [Puia sp.]|nr:PepSY-like domain-containing protein [Puia sp.]
MKKVIVLQFLFVSLSTYAQIEVPSSITTAFIKKFPDAMHVKWGKENAKEYEANFKMNGINMSANYDISGSWKETETEISVKDLPEAASKSIKTKYPNAIISGAGKIERADGKIVYEADIKWNGKKKEVELFADGKFVK